MLNQGKPEHGVARADSPPKIDRIIIREM